MKLKPLQDKVTVQELESDTLSAGGIYTGNNNLENISKGVVLETGPGVTDLQGKLNPLEVKNGDTILFYKTAGVEVTLDGEKIKVLIQNDILGVLE